MASKLALAGLLGAVADTGKDYLKRQQEIEDRQVLAAQEMRKEQARLAREKTLTEFRYNLEAPERARKFIEGEEDREERREERRERSEKEEKREQRAEERHRESVGLQKAQLDKPGELERKLEAIEKDKDLSPEEKKAAKKNLLGVNKTAKGGLTEYQESRLQDQLAKLEDTGIDETNINQANRLREQLGYPKLTKKIKAKAQEGGFFSRDIPEEVEFTEEPSGGILSAGGEPQDEEAGVAKFKAMLKKDGGIVEMAEPPKAAPAPPTGETAMTTSEQGGGPLIAPEQLGKLETMTVSQLQSLKMGILESADKAALQSQEGQDLLRKINELIARKTQLVR